MKKGLKAALALASLGLTALAVIAWTPAGAPVDRDALLAKADAFEVIVHRDTWGIPHVYGKRDADVAFGIGYAHAEDDWVTLQEAAAMARGTLGRYQGSKGAQTDYIVQLFGIWDLVDDKYESLEPHTRQVVEAFADGLNLYGAENPQATFKGLLPIRGEDIIAGFIFRTPFFFGIETEIAKLFDPDGFKKDDPVTAASEVLLRGPNREIGSNGFALAPSRSAEGVTRLLVNSHQPYAGPVAWYEARLKSEEGWDMVGGLLPGAPFVIHGHGPTLGWANTVNLPDLTDIYGLTLNPENPDQYEFDGAWRDFEVSEAALRVKLFGPFSWVVKRELLRSVHGPVLRLGHGTFAIKHVGLKEYRHAEQFLALNKAKTFDEWLSAIKIGAVPSINYVYADGEGNIAYLHNARFPNRPPGFDWQGLLPGNTSKALWDELLPVETAPILVNPVPGFVFNSNNTPFVATEEGYDLKAKNFSEDLGLQTNMTNRALRARALFSADREITKQDFYAIKFDHTYSKESDMAHLLDELQALDGAVDPLLAEALEVLASWNLEAAAENAQATLPILVGAQILTEKTAETLDQKREVLLATARDMKARFGTLEVPWGQINRIKRGGFNLPLSGGPDILRAVYGGWQLDDDNQLAAHTGDTLYYFVEWDWQGKVTSEGVHQYGSATLDETSPHYADQVPLYAAEEMRPVWFDFEDLLPNIERSYHPGR